MKLLYFLNGITNNGGMERVVIDKINYFANQEDYHVVLAFYGTENDMSFFPIDKRVELILIGALDASYKRKPLFFIRLVKKIKAIIENVKPDVIINANTKLVSWPLPFMKKDIPKILELHFSYKGLHIMNRELYADSWWKSSVNNFLRRVFYPLYDKCVVLTKEDRKDWGFSNIQVIPNFTNITSIEYNALNKKKVAVNVGRLTFQKNQRVLVDAWNIVNEKFPDWSLEIWGDGELHDELVTQISKLRLDEKVKLMGVSQHIEEVYNDASFFVLSSCYEGQPLVMIEALQSGLPCVCFAINGVRGTICEGENGYIVEEMTAEALADGIMKMIVRKDEIPVMAQWAKESVKVFEKEKIMKRWIDLFEELVS